MDTDRTTYEKAVRDHLAHRRQAMPIVPRDALSPLSAWQNRILGVDLIDWNNNHADSLLSERAVVGKLQNWQKEPIIFFISTMPGLVASQEIIGDEHGRFVWGLPEDFDSFDERDEEFIFHVEYRSLSEFRNSAVNYAKNVSQRIILIDGHRLTELMIEHNIGLNTINTMSVKRIDSDYFDRE